MPDTLYVKPAHFEQGDCDMDPKVLAKIATTAGKEKLRSSFSDALRSIC